MRRSLILALFLLGPARAQPAEKPADLASLLPADTLLMVEADDLGGVERWARETALGRLWTEPEMQYFVQGLRKSIEKAFLNGGANILGLKQADFEGIEVRRGGFAVVDARFDGGLDLDAVVSMDFRAGADKAKKIVTALRQGVEMILGPLEEIEIRGRKIARGKVESIEAFVMMHSGRLLITTKRARMEQLLTVLDEGSKASLRTAPRFVRIRQRMGADRYSFLCYADVPRIYARATAGARRTVGDGPVASFDAIWQKLGLDAMEALAFADIPSGDGFRTELAILLRERRGVFGFFTEGKPSHRFLRHAPRECVLYGSERFDLDAFWGRLLELAGRFDPSIRQKLVEFEQQASGFLGVDLRKDIAAALGTEWSGYVAAPPGGGLIPDVALFVTLRDRARLEKAIETIVTRVRPAAARNGVSLELRETLFRGARIRFVEMAEADGDPIPVAPAWAFGEDYVVFALAPQTIKHALIEKPSLEGSEDFRALSRQIPASAVSVTYVDLKGLVGWIYNTAAPVLQALQGGLNKTVARYGVELNLQDLPPAGVLTRHLGGAVFYTAVEKDCVRIGYVSPFGAPLMLVPVALAAGLAVVVIPKGIEMADVPAERVRERDAAIAELEALRLALAKERARVRMFRERINRIERELAELKKLLKDRDKR